MLLLRAAIVSACASTLRFFAVCFSGAAIAATLLLKRYGSVAAIIEQPRHAAEAQRCGAPCRRCRSFRRRHVTMLFSAAVTPSAVQRYGGMDRCRHCREYVIASNSTARQGRHAGNAATYMFPSLFTPLLLLLLPRFMAEVLERISLLRFSSLRCCSLPSFAEPPSSRAARSLFLLYFD